MAVNFSRESRVTGSSVRAGGGGWMFHRAEEEIVAFKSRGARTFAGSRNLKVRLLKALFEVSQKSTPRYLPSLLVEI